MVANDNNIKMKPMIVVSLRLFSILEEPVNDGARKMNEMFKVMNLISYSIMNRPCGLN